MRIIYNCKTGKLEKSDDFNESEPITWHYDECPIRIIFTDDVKHDWLLKYQEHQLIGTYPDICQMMELVKSMTDKRVYHNGETHIYLEELYDEHKTIILAHGATIEYKP